MCKVTSEDDIEFPTETHGYGVFDSATKSRHGVSWTGKTRHERCLECVRGLHKNRVNANEARLVVAAIGRMVEKDDGPILNSGLRNRRFVELLTKPAVAVYDDGSKDVFESGVACGQAQVVELLKRLVDRRVAFCRRNRSEFFDREAENAWRKLDGVLMKGFDACDEVFESATGVKIKELLDAAISCEAESWRKAQVRILEVEDVRLGPYVRKFVKRAVIGKGVHYLLLKNGLMYATCEDAEGTWGILKKLLTAESKDGFVEMKSDWRGRIASGVKGESNDMITNIKPFIQTGKGSRYRLAIPPWIKDLKIVRDKKMKVRNVSDPGGCLKMLSK